MDLNFLATCRSPVAVDTETSGLRWWDRDSVGVVSFAWGPVAEASAATRDVKNAAKAVQDRLNNSLPTVFHNSSFDLHFLSTVGVKPNWKAVDDTLLMARLRNNLGDNRLKPLGEELFGMEPDKQDVLKKWLAKHKGSTYLDAPDEVLLPYAAEDTVITWRLHQALSTTVNQNLYQRELILRRLMFDAEETGVLVNPVLVQQRLDRALSEQRLLYAKLQSLRGREFNPDSNPDLIEWLYGELGLTPASYTQKGAPQVDEYNLLSNPHPATRLLIAYSKRTKSAEFLQSYLDLMGEDCVIHPTVNTMAARTHRFSCNSPNLQQIPVRNDRFRIREAFVSGGGYFIGADFAKQELFIAACEAGETKLMTDLAQGKEVYVDLAKVMLGKSSISSSERNAAKVAILSMLYGAGAPKIAESFTVNTGRPYTVAQAAQIRSNVKQGYPGLARLMRDTMNQAQTRGFVTNRWGRQLYVQPERAYVATDYLVQSSGRDVLGDALINVSQVLPKYNGKLLWPIHDEVLAWVPEKPTQKLLDEYAAAMECTRFELPLTATPHFGKNLLELK